TDRFAQAEVLRLYDPDRSTTLMHLDDIATWSNAVDALRVAAGQEQARRGAGLRIVTPTVTSPTLAAQIAAFLAKNPDARWGQSDPASRDAPRAAARTAFGSPCSVRYDLAAADVVVALDSDLLTQGPGNVRYGRDAMARRRPHEGAMNRLYVAETMPSGTGSVADHPLGGRPPAGARADRGRAARGRAGRRARRARRRTAARRARGARRALGAGGRARSRRASRSRRRRRRRRDAGRRARARSGDQRLTR